MMHLEGGEIIHKSKGRGWWCHAFLMIYEERRVEYLKNVTSHQHEIILPECYPINSYYNNTQFFVKNTTGCRGSKDTILAPWNMGSIPH